MIFIVLGIIKIKLDIFCEVGKFCMLYVCHLQHVQCLSLHANTPCAFLCIVCFGHVTEVIGEISNSTVSYQQKV